MRERSRAPDGRILAAVALLAGLLLIVAAGVGGDAHAGRSRQASPLAVRVLVDVGLGAAAATALVIAGGLASALWSRRKKEPPAERRVYQAPPVPWALRVALFVFFLLVAAGVVAVLRGASSDERPSRPVPPATGALPLQDEQPTDGGSIGADAPVVAAVAVLGLTAAALVTRQARRRRWAAPHAPPLEPGPTAPAPAGEIGVEDLLAEHDARRAVEAAYARMERVLATAGVARHPSDAPFEYLARVRRAIAPVGPPAARLTELFERAKFSAAGVDRAMQAEAVAALRAVIEQGTVPA